ncbi:MAG: DUF1002 domain-containing protein [Clostridium sp.]|uniref:DUF1002 domain-containing protein n=1 Tax=Clostridium sp. TaxID=1506 RepID=UPI003EE58A8C
MKRKKIIGITVSLAIAGSIMLPGLSAFADQFNVISIGANLNSQQQQEMLQYFNAPNGSYEKIMINNQEEQQELQGIVPESEIGTRTISCAYVQPTSSGGINVKTANLTYVTASMISNALTTAGIYNANVIAAAPFPVSGTGALTGIMTGYEKATGQTISPEKKQLANKEMQVTSNIASDPNVGQTKAAAVVNGVKAKVIQNGNQDSSQVAQTINNVTNNYGVSLTPAQEKDLNNVMVGISQQNYNKSEMEKTLDHMQEQLNKVLDQQGQLNGFMNKLEVHFDSFVNWVKGIFTNGEKEAGIVNQTNNNSNIGKTAVVTGNDQTVQNTTATPETPAQKNATLTNNQTNNNTNSNSTNNTTASNINNGTNSAQNTGSNQNATISTDKLCDNIRSQVTNLINNTPNLSQAFGSSAKVKEFVDSSFSNSAIKSSFSQLGSKVPSSTTVNVSLSNTVEQGAMGVNITEAVPNAASNNQQNIVVSLNSGTNNTTNTQGQ